MILIPAAVYMAAVVIMVLCIELKPRSHRRKKPSNYNEDKIPFYSSAQFCPGK